MRSGVQEKKGLQKFLLAFIVLALAVAMMGLPMFTQTVKAEEQVKVEVTYIYVNANGDNNLYVDIQYVPVGTTWGDFFAGYQKCYNSGVIADANPKNQWKQSVQNVTYQKDTDCYADEIKNFNQYTDCALVTLRGLPANYEEIGVSFEYYENGECVDSGTGWDLLMPSAYAFGSEEAINYIARNKSIHSFIEEYCNRPGVVVEIEAYYESTDDKRIDLYNVKITASAEASSNDFGSEADSGSAESYAAPAVAAESTYTSETGEAMRRIAAEGNATVAIDGAQEYLPAGSKFACVQLTSGDAYTRASEIVSKKVSGMTAFKVFEMNLADASNAAIHQLKGYINVTLPIPEGLSASDGKLLMVYRIEDDGTLTRCETATKNGYLTFATNHFSTYVIVEQSAITSPKTGEESAAFIVGMLAVTAGAAGSVYFRKKRIVRN